jgi:hypothetical protein
MSLPVPSFAALAGGGENLSLYDQQFAALAAQGIIACTASGVNALILTPFTNYFVPSSYTDIAPVFSWKQPSTSGGPVTINFAGLGVVNAYRNNGQTAVGSGDLVANCCYTGAYVAALNSGAGGVVVDAFPVGGNSGSFLQLNNYTTGGSATLTIVTGASRAYVKMWGATGGSGGVTGGGTGAASGGTGAGGYLEKLLTGLTPGNTLIYVQGAKGDAGAVSGNGGNGTVTTLASGTQTISTLTCNASNGSLAVATSIGAGTTGGTATGGDINIRGQTGDSPPSTFIQGGVGARNFFSVGADGVASTGSIGGMDGNTGGLLVLWFS